MTLRWKGKKYKRGLEMFKKWQKSQRPSKTPPQNIDSGEKYAIMSAKRCRDRELRMIKHDARIGRAFDFKAGGGYNEDMSFERDKTLLQLWEIYRNGYTTDQVLNTMYIPVIVIENGGRVKCCAEKCSLDDTMISELRARYQEIKEEELLQREQDEIAKYNELHGISRGEKKMLNGNLLDAISLTGSPRPSRPHSILSYSKESPFTRSMEQDQYYGIDDEQGLLKGADKLKDSCPIICYCCYMCFKTEE